jgi:hypothetical protein
LTTVEASWSTLERMVNENLERTLVVTSYGASGTLSLERKTLKPCPRHEAVFTFQHIIPLSGSPVHVKGG